MFGSDRSRNTHARPTSQALFDREVAADDAYNFVGCKQDRFLARQIPEELAKG
jgi:hypothetical protein